MVSRTQLAASDRRWAVKLALRVVILIASLIALSCHAWIITGYTQFAYWDTGWILALVLVAAFSMIWCLANIAFNLIRSKQIHPGANVGCDLVIWLLYTTSSINVSYPTWSYHARQRQKAILAVRVRMVGIVFAYIAVILHFTLFVIACRDCDRRNKTKKDWQATSFAEDIINNGMDGRRNTYIIAHAQPIYAPIPQIYGMDAQQPPYQQPFLQQQTQYQGPEMPKYGTGYMAVPQQAAFHHPPPPGTVGIEAGRGGNYF